MVEFLASILFPNWAAWVWVGVGVECGCDEYISAREMNIDLFE